MKRLIIITIAICSSCLLSNARDSSFPRMTFGVEWGYIATFYSGYHYNFFAPEGYRVDPRGHSFGFDSNAEGYLTVGYNLDERLNISAYIGMSAVMDHHFTIPASIRLTRYYGKDPMKDRWLSFLDIGSGIIIKKKPQEILTGKLGGGYRMTLSRNTKLDFLVAYRCILTHPDIEYYGTPVPHDRINRNNSYSSALSIGIALIF